MFDLVFVKLLMVNFCVTFTKIYGPCPCLLTSAALRYRLPERSLYAIQYFSLPSKQRPCCWRQFTDIAATCRRMTERPVSQLDHSVRSTDEGDTATTCWPHTSRPDVYVSLLLILVVVMSSTDQRTAATCCCPTQRAVSALDHTSCSARSQNSESCVLDHIHCSIWRYFRFFRASVEFWRTNSWEWSSSQLTVQRMHTGHTGTSQVPGACMQVACETQTTWNDQTRYRHAGTACYKAKRILTMAIKRLSRTNHDTLTVRENWSSSLCSNISTFHL